MAFFLYGDSLLKINDEIAKIYSKEKYTKVLVELTEENYLDLGPKIFSENLFGDKYLYILDITDTENQTIEKFFSDKEALKLDNIVVICRKNLISSSKIIQIFKGCEIKELKDTSENIFELADLIISGDISKVYKEIEKHKKLEEVYVFNMVVSGFRSVEYLILGMNQASKIPPFKKGFYQKVVQNYNELKIKEISQKLFDLDLKFKTGEITEDMLLTSTILLFNKR
jgi:DNA polymerase III delta subunit